MPEPMEVELTRAARTIAEAFPESLMWEWDDRFDGVLAAFAIADKDPVLAVLGAQLGEAWSCTNIDNAPDNVRDAVKSFGGLMEHQMLFTYAGSRKPFLLGLWWPWGNGATISVRIVPYGLADSNCSQENIRAALQGAFGCSR